MALVSPRAEMEFGKNGVRIWILLEVNNFKDLGAVGEAKIWFYDSKLKQFYKFKCLVSVRFLHRSSGKVYHLIQN